MVFAPPIGGGSSTPPFRPLIGYLLPFWGPTPTLFTSPFPPRVWAPTGPGPIFPRHLNDPPPFFVPGRDPYLDPPFRDRSPSSLPAGSFAPGPLFPLKVGPLSGPFSPGVPPSQVWDPPHRIREPHALFRNTEYTTALVYMYPPGNTSTTSWSVFPSHPRKIHTLANTGFDQ